MDVSHDTSFIRSGFCAALCSAAVCSLLRCDAAALAQGRADDSYKGPAPGGGLEDSSAVRPAAPAPQGGSGRGSGAPAPGGGLRGRQTEGTIAPIPVAIPVFLGDDPQLAADIANVVQADLERSGLFQPLDRASFLEQVRDVNAAPRFPDWRAIRADDLVVGRVARTPTAKSAPNSACGTSSRASSSPASGFRPQARTGGASGTSSPIRSTSS